MKNYLIAIILSKIGNLLSLEQVMFSFYKHHKAEHFMKLLFLFIHRPMGFALSIRGRAGAGFVREPDSTFPVPTIY